MKKKQKYKFLITRTESFIVLRDLSLAAVSQFKDDELPYYNSCSIKAMLRKIRRNYYKQTQWGTLSWSNASYEPSFALEIFNADKTLYKSILLRDLMVYDEKSALNLNNTFNLKYKKRRQIVRIFHEKV